MGWIDNETFDFWMPVQAVQVKKSSDGKDSSRRWIQGIASTEARDLQGEFVRQNGIDFSYFIKYGYFNNDHKPGHKHKVGQPVECRITKNGLWVKGFLFKNKESADEIWEHLQSLEASQSSRKLGFSIQGKVKRREGNVIEECWIQDIAITPAPVNTSTWAEIAKSLSSQKWDLSKDKEKEDKDEKEEKALEASGNPLVPESLHGKKTEDRTSKSLSFDQAISYYMETKDLPREVAEKVAVVAFGIFGRRYQ